MPRHFAGGAQLQAGSAHHDLPTSTFPFTFSTPQPPSPHTPSSALSVLNDAALTSANLSSSTPLIAHLQSVEQKLNDVAQRSDWDTRTADCETTALPLLTTLLTLLSQRTRNIAAATPTSSPCSSTFPSLIARFPDLDRLLSFLFLRLAASPTSPVLPALLGCCSAWLSATAGAGQRPRWLVSPPTSPSPSDSALLSALSTSLASPTSSWQVRSSAVSFLTALTVAHASRATHVPAWLSLPSLLTPLLDLCRIRSSHWSARVQSLCANQQSRLLLAVFSGAARQEGRSTPPSAAEEGDGGRGQQGYGDCLEMVRGSWKVLTAVIQAHTRGAEQMSAYSMCRGDAFSSLLQSVAQLWSSHAAVLPFLASPTSSPSPAPSTPSPAASVVFLLTTALSALLCFFDRPPSSPSPSLPLSFPVSSFCQLLADVLRTAAGWWFDTSLDLQARRAALSVFPPIATVLKRGFSGGWNVDSCLPSLFAVVHALLTAARSIPSLATTPSLPPSSSAASLLSVDTADECVKAALQVHTAFISHCKSASREQAMAPAFGLSCGAFLPLAMAVLEGEGGTATVDVVHLTFASLHLLLHLPPAAPSSELLPTLLSLLLRSGLIKRSWRCLDALSLAASQSSPLDADDQRRTTAALSACRRWVAAVIAAITFSPAVTQTDDRAWEEALRRPFAGDDPQCWHRMAQSTTIPTQQLSMLLPLCTVSLLTRAVQARDTGEKEGKQRETSGVDFAEKDVLRLVQDVLTSSFCLDASILVQLILLAVLLEDDFRLSLSSNRSKAKASLFSHLTSAAVTLADLTLSPSVPSHLTPTSLTHWVWRQSPTVPAVASLHDHLLSTLFTFSVLTFLHGVDDAWTDGGHSLSSTGHPPPLASASEWLAEEPNALKAMVRRWTRTVEPLRSPSARSAAVDQLLQLTRALLPLIPSSRMLAAGLLQPVVELLTVGYHRLLQPSAGADAVELAACLLSILQSLLSTSTPAAACPLDSEKRVEVLDGTLHILLSYGEGGGREAALERVEVQLLCLELLNAMLRLAVSSGDSMRENAEKMQTPAVQMALSALVRHGQSLAPTSDSMEGAQRAAAGRRRVAFTTAAGLEERVVQVRLVRLQMQLAAMELSTFLYRHAGSSGAGIAPPLVPCDDALPLLHHRCVDVRTLALRYMAAVATRKETIDPAVSAQLLLSIQPSLLPHCSAQLAAAALDAFHSLLSSSTSAARLTLTSHPWHTFVIHSSLLSLCQVEASLPSTCASTARLLHLLYLLSDVRGGTGCRGGDAGDERCIARLHLAQVDERLLTPLLSLSPLHAQTSAAGSTVCVSSLLHFVTVLTHLHHARCVPLSAAAALPQRLRTILTFIQRSAQPDPVTSSALPCPASQRALQPPRFPTSSETARTHTPRLCVLSPSLTQPDASGFSLSQPSPPSQPPSSSPSEDGEEVQVGVQVEDTLGCCQCRGESATGGEDGRGWAVGSGDGVVVSMSAVLADVEERVEMLLLALS